ncbi:MAG: hypothetical protein JJU00_19645 [Opitutales bacterium]|nr:hypothetical protein [Opitutales bacterium]
MKKLGSKTDKEVIDHFMCVLASQSRKTIRSLVPLLEDIHINRPQLESDPSVKEAKKALAAQRRCGLVKAKKSRVVGGGAPGLGKGR